MSSIDLFLPDSTEPLAKPRFVCYEKDWKLLQQVFPETGFTSYFPGLLVHILATYLKENGITTYIERSERPELANLSHFLSNIKFAGDENHPDERRGVGPARGEVAECAGEPTGNAESPRRETEEGKGRKDCEEGGPKQPGTLTFDKEFDKFLAHLIKRP